MSDVLRDRASATVEDDAATRRPGPASSGEIAEKLLAALAAGRSNFHHDGATDWSISAHVIRFLAAETGPDTVTLETGAGLSTALFAALGSRHFCICADGGDVDRVRAYCRDNGFPVDRVEFVTALSEDALPVLNAPALDLVLIDGGHGFPMPIVDWYYTARKLKVGGLMVIDDIDLWPCGLLVDFLKGDAGWTSMGRVGRRAFAFRKAAPFQYREFWLQPYVVRKSAFSKAVNRLWSAWDLARTGQFGEMIRRARSRAHLPGPGRPRG